MSTAISITCATIPSPSIAMTIRINGGKSLHTIFKTKVLPSAHSYDNVINHHVIAIWINAVIFAI